MGAPPKATSHLRGASSRRFAMVAGAIVPTVLLVVGATTYGAYTSWFSGDLIAPGVSIAGEEVGGLSRSEAEDRLTERFSRVFINLETDARPFKVSLSELGGRPQISEAVEKAFTVGRDGSPVNNLWRVYGAKATGQRFSLPVAWDRRILLDKLRSVNHLYTQKATDARLRVTSGGVQIDPEVHGRRLNLGETALRVQKRYYIGLPELEIATQTVTPRVTRENLAGTDVRLSFFTTRFNPGDRGRTKNVHNASTAIDGQVVGPGQLFSFNACTGERTAEKGYKMAHIFITEPGEEEAEIVDGLAGGTCQVSSTLFNAVRVVNKKYPGALQVVERNHHSLPVAYVPKGQDATVAWPGKDFRFRNLLPNPVYLRTSITGAHLTVGVWCRVPGGAPNGLPKGDGAEPPATPAAPLAAGETTVTGSSGINPAGTGPV